MSHDLRSDFEAPMSSSQPEEFKADNDDGDNKMVVNEFVAQNLQRFFQEVLQNTPSTIRDSMEHRISKLCEQNFTNLSEFNGYDKLSEDDVGEHHSLNDSRPSQPKRKKMKEELTIDQIMDKFINSLNFEASDDVLDQPFKIPDNPSKIKNLEDGIDRLRHLTSLIGKNLRITMVLALRTGHILLMMKRLKGSTKEDFVKALADSDINLKETRARFYIRLYTLVKCYPKFKYCTCPLSAFETFLPKIESHLAMNKAARKFWKEKCCNNESIKK